MTSRSNREARPKKKKYSNKQIRLMAAAANDPEVAKRKGIKQSVAKKFTKHKAESGELSKAMKDYHGR